LKTRKRIDMGRYALTGSHSSWQEAQEECLSYGGRMAMPTSPAENEEVRAIIPDNQFVWIGATDLPGGRWRRADGTLLLGHYENWLDGEPNNYTSFESPSGEHCAFMARVTGKWYDGNCRQWRRFICQDANMPQPPILPPRPPAPPQHPDPPLPPPRPPAPPLTPPALPPLPPAPPNSPLAAVPWLALALGLGLGGSLCLLVSCCCFVRACGQRAALVCCRACRGQRTMNKRELTQFERHFQIQPTGRGDAYKANEFTSV